MKTMLILSWRLRAGRTAAPVWAWGPEGHAIVGDIAASFLTPAPKRQVKAILGNKKLGDYEIASWPDIIRGNKEYEAIYPGNGQWHYVDFDVAQHYDEDFELKPPEDGQDIVTQIVRWQKELAATDNSRPQRLDAVRFLVHFVGDVHQPLHCAYRYGDMGGNMIPVHSFQGQHYSFDADTPMDYAPNLHTVWDEYLVNELMAGRTPTTFAKWVKEITAPSRSSVGAMTSRSGLGDRQLLAGAQGGLSLDRRRRICPSSGRVREWI